MLASFVACTRGQHWLWKDRLSAETARVLLPTHPGQCFFPQQIKATNPYFLASNLPHPPSWHDERQQLTFSHGWFLSQRQPDIVTHQVLKIPDIATTHQDHFCIQIFFAAKTGVSESSSHHRKECHILMLSLGALSMFTLILYYYNKKTFVLQTNKNIYNKAEGKNLVWFINFHFNCSLSK